MRSITEETVLFLSIAKWFVLASIIGVLTGLSTSLFIYLLTWSISNYSRYPYYFLILPPAFFLSSWLVKTFAPEAEGHGTEKVIEAVHQKGARIQTMVVPIKLLSTIITLAAGGSAGKEGPCAQIGGGLASTFAEMFRFSAADRKKFVICGISAGFASVFGTPIAGAIFGIEVLLVGGMMYEVLLPSFIAGVTAYQVSTALGIGYFYQVIDLVPAFSEALFLEVILGGILFGLSSLLLIESMQFFHQLSRRLPFHPSVKAFLGGMVLVGLALLFSERYLGLGLETIEATLAGEKAYWWDFVLKILFTSVTLSFGGSGGIVTPIFFIGVTLGSFYGEVMNVNPAAFAAIGMVSLLAGAANTPIAASILAIELFGPKIAPYAATSCVTAFLMTGHRSVYPSQIYAILKSASFKGGIGKQVEEMQTEFVLRHRSLTRLLLSLSRKFFSGRKK